MNSGNHPDVPPLSWRDFCRAVLVGGFLFCVLAPRVFAGSALEAAEYFIGEDPGEGQGISIEIEDAGLLHGSVETVALNNEFTPGTHTVGVRVRDTEGRWSLPMLRRFTVFPADFSMPEIGGADDPPLNGIAGAEYFVGAPPPPGEGTPLAVSESFPLTAALDSAVLPGGVAPGNHAVGLRVRDHAGRWSTPLWRRFTVFPAAAVAAVEESFDGTGAPALDPAARQRHRVGVARRFACDQMYAVQVGGHEVTLAARPFESGAHFLERLKRALQDHAAIDALVEVESGDGKALVLTARSPGRLPDDWVAASDHLAVSMERPGSLGSEGRRIVAAEYFLNVTGVPGEGNPLAMETEAHGHAAGFAAESIPVEELRAGTHLVGLRFQNSAGEWGQPVFRRFSVFSLSDPADTVPPVITLVGGEEIDWPVDQEPFVDPGFSAHDEIDGDLSAFVSVAGSVDPNTPGIYPLLYEVSDRAGNVATAVRQVRVVYESSPTFVGPDSLHYAKPPALIDWFEDIAATDVRYGDISHRIRIVSSDLNWFEPGTYEITFAVDDPSGNTATLTRTVSLEEDAVFYPSYETWIAAHGARVGAAPEDLHPDANPDGDEWTNYEEWLADTDPFDASSRPDFELVAEGSHDWIIWSGQHRIVYHVEYSEDLREWTPLGDEIVFDEDCLIMLERESDAGKPRFYRLRFGPRQPVFPTPGGD